MLAALAMLRRRVCTDGNPYLPIGGAAKSAGAPPTINFAPVCPETVIETCPGLPSQQTVGQAASSFDGQLLSRAGRDPNEPGIVVDDAGRRTASPGLECSHGGLGLGTENTVDRTGVGGEFDNNDGSAERLLKPGHGRPLGSLFQLRRWFAISG